MKRPKFCEKTNCDYYERFGECCCFAPCPKCGKETYHIDRICIECGTSLLEGDDND